MMPTLRKLTPEEVETLEGRAKGPRKLIEEQYDRLAVEFDAGDYVEVELEPDEKRLSVRNRLIAAAKRRGLTLDFLRTTGDVLRFRVHAPNGVPPVAVAVAPPLLPPTVVTEAAPPAKKRPGRPKKIA
jgi:hypothetical protein